MTFLPLLAGAILVAVALVVLLAVLLRFDGLQRDIRSLEERLARLEGGPAPATPAEPAPSAPVVPVAAAPLPSPAPAPAAPAAERVPLEQLVGGIWLQGVGSVLVLLGAFFLILWGYTTGRLGPGALVGAGAALGLALAWRGHGVGRRLPAFGHALIGIGIGVVYVTFYLGHFTLHALGPGVAFVLLGLVSLGAVGLGWLERSEAVAALGVLGAFLPRLLAAALGLRAFALAPGPLLGYLAVVDATVLGLAALGARGARPSHGMRGRLDLLALALTTVTWIAAFATLRWGAGVQVGLAALFAVLGLAPAAAFARRPGRVPGAALATAVVAPLGFLAASWPFLAWARPVVGATLLLALALAWMLAARWVEARRGDEDLWRPLAGAAVLFLGAAAERALGPERTAIAWCAEALALVWLGLRGRPWLRAYGYVVGAVGGLWVLSSMGEGWTNDLLPVLHPAGLRTLGSLLCLGLAVARVERERGRLGPAERAVSRAGLVGLNLLILTWTAIESGHVALALHGTGGRWAGPPVLGALPGPARAAMLCAVLTSLAWLAQALVLLVRGWRRTDPFLRWLGLALSGFTVAKFLLFDLASVDVFWRFLIALVVGAALLGVSYFYQRRTRAQALV